MLRCLRINRLAVIDTVDIEFEPGFNVLTGETGAGKSILVEAVGLLLGGRASGDLVRTGEDLATVEAIFQRGGEEVLIRREVTALGRSRAFINGALATAGSLRDRTSGLIELHGQHEHQTLMDPSTHLFGLDAFGGLEADLALVSQAFSAWCAEIELGRQLRAAAHDRSATIELASFQLEEIRRAGVDRLGEDDELAMRRRVLTNAARLEQLCAESYAILYERDDAVLAALSAVWRRVGELATIDPVFEPHIVAREGIKAQLEELAAALRRYTDGLDVSPARLQQVEERMNVLDRLKRKYGPTLEQVISRRGALEQTLSELESAGERIGAHERELARLRDAFLQVADRLSARRRHVAGVFTSTLVGILEGLALERARFEVRFNLSALPETDWTAQGIDRAEFFLSPNPGEELRPLARIISGGELSRIMLALKTMIFGARLERASADHTVQRRPGVSAPVMVFDEVDAGLGGRVAEIVGRRLRDLGSAFQVLCITHLPQVAAHADTHFAIEKTLRGGRTETRVRRLTPPERVDEMARMLAGSAVSEAVLASARELLERGCASVSESEHNTKVLRATGGRPLSTRKRRDP